MAYIPKQTVRNLEVHCSHCREVTTISKLNGIPKPRDLADDHITRYLHRMGWTGEAPHMKCSKCKSSRKRKGDSNVELLSAVESSSPAESDTNVSSEVPGSEENRSPDSGNVPA